MAPRGAEPALKRPRREATKKQEEAEGDEEEEEEEEDEEEGSESELELTVDPDGRIAWEGGAGLDFSFRSFPRFLEAGSEDLARLQSDCSSAFTARAVQPAGGQNYSSGETYWVGANATPAAALEELALEIFRLHTANATFDAALSGAEWWTLVMDPEDAVGWHWDKDYGIEADEGLSIHPHIATVTYLSGGGAPTVVLDRRCGLRAETIPGPVSVAHVCYPEVGKHIAFDGRLLHAAPAELAVPARPAAKGGKRTTFLVNIWLNHRPVQTVPFSQPTQLSAGAPALAKKPTAAALVRLEDCECEAKLSWGFGVEGSDSDEEGEEEGTPEKPKDGGAEGKADGAKDSTESTKPPHTIRMALPLRHLKEAATKGTHHSFAVALPAGAACVE